MKKIIKGVIADIRKIGRGIAADFRKITKGIAADIRGAPEMLKEWAEELPGRVRNGLKLWKDRLRDRINAFDIKARAKAAVPYMLLGFLFDKLSYLWRTSGEGGLVFKLASVMSHIAGLIGKPLISVYRRDVLCGIICAAGIRLYVHIRAMNGGKYRKGAEYGSARWGNAKDIAPYIDPDFSRNIILTATERLMMNSRPKQVKYARNKNVLIIGGSGSGKTRFYVKPNLMQAHSSYVVTDPKGTLLLECGTMLFKTGYRIKVVNTINFKKSMHYNPFAYIRSEKDILKLVNTIIANTKGEGAQAGEDFWVKAERLLYTAYIAYIWYEAPEDEKNFAMLIDMLDASEAREEDESFKNSVDHMFDELEKKNPRHFAVRQYRKYKLAAGKTAKSILISCGARLAPFDIMELREMMSYDDLELDKLGERKTALFVIISDTDDTFNFVVSMMYSQLFNLLCDMADDVYHGKLPVHVRCLLDEFKNIGQIPQFDKLIATMRSREISASVILQSKSQLEDLYKKNAETIEDNCDTLLFLGGKGKTTLKDMSELLGKETIDLYNVSDTRGRDRSYGLNYQKTGKDLMSPDEIAVMDGGKCIMQLRGVRPFLSDKYDITKHERYIELSDYNPGNIFDVEAYVKNPYQTVITKNTVIDEYMDCGEVVIKETESGYS